MVVQLVDKSLDSTCDTVALHIFHADEKTMPTFKLADIVMAKGMKVQKTQYSNELSLLSGYSTVIHTYRPRASSPTNLDHEQWIKHPEYQTIKRQDFRPSPLEDTYAAYLHKTINRSVLPDIVSFEIDAEKSRHVRHKRQELKDVADGMFCDLLVNVVADPIHTDFPRATLWVSDYSENRSFRDYSQPSAGGGRYHEIGDANGYLTKFGGQTQRQGHQHAPTSWSGPCGRRSMRITCYSPHCDVIKEEVKRNSWVELKNVQIKWENGVLEGTLHEDRDYPDRIGVSMVETKDRELKDIDERFVAAVKRKRAYKKGFKAEGRKRKELHGGSEPGTGRPLNSKQKRKLNRTEGGKAQTTAVVPLANQPNPAIRAEFPDRAVVPLSRVLDPSLYKAPGSEEVRLPFANIKFKTQVRVVDFLPHCLLDFAVSRRTSEFDMVKDDSSSSQSSSEEDSDGGGELIWEWRFALCLEDASSTVPDNNDGSSGGSPPPRVWVAVDNFHGQTLICDDACDLRKNKKERDILREKLFLMWGNMEEIKQGAEDQRLLQKKAADEAAKEAARQKEAAEAVARVAEKERVRKEQEKRAARERRERERERVAVNGANMMHYGRPDEGDSEDDDDEPAQAPAPVPASAPEQTARLADIAKKLAEPLPKLDNRPFVCCLQQYGVRCTVNSNGKGTGEGRGEEGGGSKQTWQQMFGMFGTTIRN